MRKLLIIALLIQISSFAQVKGNKNVVTKNYKVENLTEIKINLYAKITIDVAEKEGMTITADSNLFNKIDTEVIDGKLNLNQKEWIQPSQNIIIKIGAPKIRRIEKGTHETLKVKNINTDFLNIMAPIGKVIASGKVSQLNLGIENGTIDASKLIAEDVLVNIWGNGKAIVYGENKVNSILKKEGRLALANIPKKITGDTKKALKFNEKIKNSKVDWIRFKIKNNSWNRQNFYVVGPKKDGSKFSYGFAMMPGATRKENWTTGTKIYKVNKVGLRKFLVKIKKEDEGATVKLF